MREHSLINENAEKAYNFMGNFQANTDLKRTIKVLQKGIFKNKLGKPIKYITSTRQVFFFKVLQLHIAC